MSVRPGQIRTFGGLCYGPVSARSGGGGWSVLAHFGWAWWGLFGSLASHFSRCVLCFATPPCSVVGLLPSRVYAVFTVFGFDSDIAFLPGLSTKTNSIKGSQVWIKLLLNWHVKFVIGRSQEEVSLYLQSNAVRLSSSAFQTNIQVYIFGGFTAPR